MKICHNNIIENKKIIDIYINIHTYIYIIIIKKNKFYLWNQENHQLLL